MKRDNDSIESSDTSSTRLSISQCASLACILEATAPKPGNVHRGCDFEDMTYLDFAVSAMTIGPVMEKRAGQGGVGETVLQAVEATRRMVAVNTNLGTLLLLAPLVCVPREQSLSSGLADVLSSLTRDDARLVYEAIRVAAPGGLGEVDEMDVADAAPEDLLVAMHAAADRDLVARQYTNNFEQVLEFVAPSLCAGCESGWSLTDSIIYTHLKLIADYPDSLIARKCGVEVAQRAANIAARALATPGPGDERYWEIVADLDFWLRCDGNRRNPGTTADLIAAGLFVVLRDDRIQPPFR